MPQIPRAFVNHTKIKYVLCCTIEDFGYEEKEAIGFFCYLGAPISEISEATGLSQNHIESVICLYSERLATKLDIFKKALPYDTNDLLPVSEILSLEL